MNAFGIHASTSTGACPMAPEPNIAAAVAAFQVQPRRWLVQHPGAWAVEDMQARAVRGQPRLHLLPPAPCAQGWEGHASGQRWSSLRGLPRFKVAPLYSCMWFWACARSDQITLHRPQTLPPWPSSGALGTSQTTPHHYLTLPPRPLLGMLSAHQITTHHPKTPPPGQLHFRCWVRARSHYATLKCCLQVGCTRYWVRATSQHTTVKCCLQDCCTGYWACARSAQTLGTCQANLFPPGKGPRG